VRAVFLALLAVNLAVAGYAWYASTQSNPDAQLLRQQLNAQQIRIIAPRPMVTQRPKAACLEWGAFGGVELKAAQAALDALNLGARVTHREVPTQANYWVYLPPLKNKEEVDHKLGELQSLGLEDYAAVGGEGAMRNAISLGIFRTEEAANNYLEAVRQKGVRSARVGKRESRLVETTFLIQEPDVPLTAKLAELRQRFPGTELKALDCP